jgi:hypothetical protein
MKPNWKLMISIRGAECLALYRDDELRVQKEEYYNARRLVSGERSPSKLTRYYFVDGDHHQYRSEAAMLAALEGRKQ